MKERKSIRFEDTILKDIEAYAGTHKLKEQDGSYDFSNAIHMRYIELLQKERDLNVVRADLMTWKTYAATQSNTKAVYCEPFDKEVSPQECRICAEKRLNIKCPKIKPVKQEQDAEKVRCLETNAEVMKETCDQCKTNTRIFPNCKLKKPQEVHS